LISLASNMVVLGRVISMNSKLGVNLHFTLKKIYIKKTLKNRKNKTELGGGVISQLGGLYPPRGGVKISLVLGRDPSPR